jgi:hypothetical protein
MSGDISTRNRPIGRSCRDGAAERRGLSLGDGLMVLRLGYRR